MLRGEATNTNFMVFGFNGSGLPLMIYHTRGEHAKHYTTDAVNSCMIIAFNNLLVSNSHMTAGNIKL
jgi:hypothetical protein